ncbi:TPA: hypothetical protein M2O93_003467 [Klebsiella pneumoniae]|nr:hypothetical protein [Klebsiella michiganensis]HCB1752227.1 hypothetical protein [Klebsiella oxytoca]HCB9076673.1 hypothetical protein [Klebsiella pneumoniae]HCB1759089.1 hypothetical protein [Klebsiella oxytoca]HCB1840382.1 hypothetical protein [Klebsiella oxytoca]
MAEGWLISSAERENMPTTVKIQFMDKDGIIVPDSSANPVIPIIIAASSEEDENKGVNVEHNVSTFALIDTGADDFYIDEKIIHQLSLPQVGTITVTTPLGVEERTIHHALISFTGDARAFGIKVVSTKMTENGANYHAVLGMRLISLGCLTLDSRQRIFHLTFDN